MQESPETWQYSFLITIPVKDVDDAPGALFSLWFRTKLYEHVSLKFSRTMVTSQVSFFLHIASAMKRIEQTLRKAFIYHPEIHSEGEMGSIFQIGMGVWINGCVHSRRDPWMCASTRKVMAWKSLLIPRRRHQIIMLTRCPWDTVRTLSPKLWVFQDCAVWENNICANMFLQWQNIFIAKLWFVTDHVINGNIFCFTLPVLGVTWGLNWP